MSSPAYPPQPTIDQAAAPSAKGQMKSTQPMAVGRMTTAPPSTEYRESEQEKVLRLRGGGEMCPGRFCFIIPCPIPCNFCII